MKKINLSDFKNKFIHIKNKGFITSNRIGDGAIGNTLEDELGIIENNESSPDIEGYELKTTRSGSNCLQTLFNKEGEWIVSQMEFLKRHGFPHTKYEGEISGQSTIKKKINNQGYYYTTDDNYLNLYSKNELIVRWNWITLVEVFNNKFPNCIKVYANSKKINNVEYFHYHTAFLCKGTNKYRFKKLLEENEISIDFRLYTRFNQNKGIRNRGTAFRIKDNKMNLLFDLEEL